MVIRMNTFLDMYSEVIYDSSQTYVLFQDDIRTTDDITASGQIRTSDEVYAYDYWGDDDIWTDDDINCGGDIDCNGTKYATISGSDGNFYKFAAVENPQVFLEMRTATALSNGSVQISLPTGFTASTTQSETYPYHIIATYRESPVVSGSSTPLYASTSGVGAGVIQINGTTGSDADIDVIVSARRKDTVDISFNQQYFDDETGERYDTVKSSSFLTSAKDIVKDIQYYKAQKRLAHERGDQARKEEIMETISALRAQEKTASWQNPNVVSNLTHYYIGAIGIVPTPSCASEVAEDS